MTECSIWISPVTGLAEWHYPDDMDIECVKLCDVLNDLAGIRTCSSCCGHGDRPYRIFFTTVLVEHLHPILRAIESSAWRVEISWSNGTGIALCMLQGPVGTADIPGGANDLATWIKQDHSNAELPEQR